MAVVCSAELSAYALPKDVMPLLRKFDQALAWCQRGGRKAPPNLRLYSHDWNTINNAVIRQGDGKFSAATVTYRGVPLVKHYAIGGN